MSMRKSRETTAKIENFTKEHPLLSTSIVGGAAVAIAIATGALTSQDHTPDAEKISEVMSSANTIALQYDCHIGGVEDLGGRPELPRHADDPVARTDVAVTVVLTVKDQAAKARHDYWNDDSLIWFEPGMFGGRVDSADWGSKFQVAQDAADKWSYTGDFTNERDKNLTITSHLYPKSNYRDGASIPVFIQQEVLITEGEQKTMFGVMPCGKLVQQDGAWVISDEPVNEEPYIK